MSVLTVDANTRYQEIEGWGATLASPGNPFDEWIREPTPERYDELEVNDPVPDEMKAKIMDAAVFDLGLNRFRLEIGPQVEMTNDNDDPQVTDFEAFRFKWQDFTIRKWLLPIKERIERRGERMVLYISYDLGSDLTPPWLLEPDEYAELAVATLTYLKENYGLEPDYWSVLNEPGNKRPGSPRLVARLIARTGARIKEAGFRTRVSGPEIVTPKQITVYMKTISETPGALEHLGQITYHLYWDPWNVEKRNEIRDWAHELGITAAQTEWLEGKGIRVSEVLYLDLVEADASSWEQYGLCWTINSYNIGGGGDYFVLESDFSDFRINTNSWFLRQFMKYVRPGDVRIAVSSTDPRIKPVAFVAPDGRQTVVVINSGMFSRNVRIEGLAPGTYGVMLTDSKNTGSSLPDEVLDPGAPLTFRMPSKSIVTFHGAADATEPAIQKTTVH